MKKGEIESVRKVGEVNTVKIVGDFTID